MKVSESPAVTVSADAVSPAVRVSAECLMVIEATGTRSITTSWADPLRPLLVAVMVVAPFRPATKRTQLLPWPSMRAIVESPTSQLTG